jgi:hypothetical protein
MMRNEYEWNFYFLSRKVVDEAWLGLTFFFNDLLMMTFGSNTQIEPVWKTKKSVITVTCIVHAE